MSGAALGSAARATSASLPIPVDVIDIAPWGRPGRDGSANGVYAEIFRRLGELSGYKLDLRLTPIKRAVTEVGAGLAKATMMLERADLNNSAVVVGTVSTLELEVWLPAGSPIKSLDQLSGKVVATLRGPAYHEEIDSNNRIVKIAVNGAVQQLEMLRQGRVDGALGVRQNFLVAMNRLGLNGSSFAEPVWLGSRRVLLWISKDLAGSAFELRMRAALNELRSSGEIDRLIAQRVYTPQ